jgi:nanoRNase/pAp phosphatase (c-di-AMP/oligoRNAs hydrolase)
MRLITRSDFDGLACGALLEALGMIDEWLFVHPRDVQDGKVAATANDIVANVPYVKGCKLWFDHHASEIERLGDFSFEGAAKAAPSCAHVIYDYYGGAAKLGHFAEMIKYVDKMDSGDLTQEEIERPEGWVLLGFIMDPRTGLGRIHDFTISNLDLMKKLASGLGSKSGSIENILRLPDVKERANVYRDQHEKFIAFVKEHGKADGNVICLDVRGVSNPPAGNRFLLYTVFPRQNISVWVVDGKQKQFAAITVGYSVINKTAKADVGSIMLGYGGGGHKQVGTCQVPYADTDKVIAEIVSRLKD